MPIKKIKRSPKKSPKRKSPKKSPKRKSPKNKSPKRKSPKNKSPKKSGNIKQTGTISSAFASQLRSIGYSQSSYLSKARSAARKTGYNPKLLHFSSNPIYKLNYDGVNFGRVGYGDYLIWSFKEKHGMVDRGYANMKRNVFRTSHSAIRGNWQSNPKSRNNLAIKILW